MDTLLLPDGGRPLRNEDLALMLGRDDLVAGLFSRPLWNFPTFGPTAFIIWGCRVTWGVSPSITSGVVSIGDELYFVAAQPVPNGPFYIRPSSPFADDVRTYADGNPRESLEFRGASITTASLGGAPEVLIPFNGQGATWLQRLGNLITPAGSIVAFNGTAAPLGWAICDGSVVNGYTTPDLRGRFVVGRNPADPDHDNVGDVGGQKETTLVGPNLPPHTHSLPAHQHQVFGANAGSGPATGVNLNSGALSGDSVTVSASGGGSTGTGPSGSVPFDNRPPYYTLTYIVKLP